ncbi:uncharacterized protein LOC122573527 [Bombus pyrosoma]|uniref:uncharacterized protein LOC122573527 n=1 Tax=Bombus pyrosoma TaxID=396416 RepID=UPI001CB8FAFF|nr:uncharacterized protein LOC122573527 [Bombus pyrosoma]XP_043595943.1 uncharacterized protein LOC122573527 [Bombus pyrosoma]
MGLERWIPNLRLLAPLHQWSSNWYLFTSHPAALCHSYKLKGNEDRCNEIELYQLTSSTSWPLSTTPMQKSRPRTPDQIEEAYLEIRQHAFRIVTVTEPPVQNAGASEPLVACYNALNEQMIQLQTLSFGSARPSRRRSRNPRRSTSRDRLQQLGFCYYHATFKERAKKCRSPCSWNQPSANTACDDSLVSRRIFVTDRKSKISFLVDTSADICVYPRNKLRGSANKDTYELFASNGSRIATYDTILVSLDLALRRALKWRFIIADVNTPIIGVDFP